MKLTKLLGEYFLGTETRNELNRQSLFYREYGEETIIKEGIDYIEKQKRKNMIDRTIPNILDLTALGFSAYSKDITSLMIVLPLTQLFRMGFFKEYKTQRKNLRKQRQKIINYVESQELEEAVEESWKSLEEDTEGEEWKKGRKEQ